MISVKTDDLTLPFQVINYDKKIVSSDHKFKSELINTIVSIKTFEIAARSSFPNIIPKFFNTIFKVIELSEANEGHIFQNDDSPVFTRVETVT